MPKMLKFEIIVPDDGIDGGELLDVITDKLEHYYDDGVISSVSLVGEYPLMFYFGIYDVDGEQDTLILDCGCEFDPKTLAFHNPCGEHEEE